MPTGIYERVVKRKWKLSEEAKRNISLGCIGVNTWTKGSSKSK